MNKALVLLYHDVFRPGSDPYGSLGVSAKSYHIAVDTFERHMQAVCDSGRRVLSLADLEVYLATRDSSPCCVITFDDGWLGSFGIAGPVLLERRLPATVFVTTDFVGKPLFADTETVRCAAASGISIGCHGASHRMLSSLSRLEVRDELRRSRGQLEDWIGGEVSALSLPGGASSGMVVREAVSAGFRLVFNSSAGFNPTRDGALGIARLGVTTRTRDEHVTRWLNGDVRPEARRRALLDVPKRIIGMRRYSQLRRLLLGETGRAGEHLCEP